MTEPDPNGARRRWLGTLARAPLAALEEAWAALPAPPAYEMIRPPEVGLVMVRGRAGGSGQRFNLGEMTATRCAVRLAGGTIGFGHVAGRDRRKAERVAAFDALFQSDPDLAEAVVAPLAAAIAAARDLAARKAAASRVQFFTMVRGE
ncbi:MAG: phosphonate C-P lyase system protein PhnG [Thalassobaculales bacterium]